MNLLNLRAVSDKTNTTSVTASWSRERSGAELQNFISKRHEDIDVSDLLAELAIDS